MDLGRHIKKRECTLVEIFAEVSICRTEKMPSVVSTLLIVREMRRAFDNICLLVELVRPSDRFTLYFTLRKYVSNPVSLDVFEIIAERIAKLCHNRMTVDI